MSDHRGSDHPRRPFRRVVLKLGGEMFGGGDVGVDPDVVSTVADQIADVVAGGVQVAVVIGGGNFFRGAQLHERGMDRARADYMGMLGTVMNCLALQDFLEREHQVWTPGCRPPSRWARSPSRTSRGAPNGTWRRAGWSSSAPASVCRTSPPTPPPPSARWRSAPRWC